jgi:hypothetical protein
MANETRETKPTTDQKYEPRDPAFYPFAAGILTAALRPRGFDTHDTENARKAGHACARLLDRGVLPEKFILPATARILHTIDRKEVLEAGSAGNPIAGARYPVLYTEGEKVRERAKLTAIGPIPTRTEAMSENAKRLEALADLSEGVRFSALMQSAIRLVALHDVTGGGGSDLAALGIVVEEIESALDNHRDAGNPLRSIANEEAGTNGARHVAYPGSLVIELMVAKALADQDEEAAQADAPPTPATGAHP